MKFTLKTMTDGSGNFEKREEIDIPFYAGVALGSHADVRGRVLTPEGVEVTIRADLDAADGSRRNDEVTRVVPAGRMAEIGKWRVGSGSHNLTVKGSTSPVTPNTELTCEIVVD
ncbi:MAG TPA: hypothetical protein VGB85_02435 [Nannocystis sp.]|jgi:hypothetical protein